jgi:antitoxin ParD1/3/4
MLIRSISMVAQPRALRAWRRDKAGTSANRYHNIVMTIQLKPEIEDLIKQDVQRGSYQSVDEYVQRAIAILHEEEELLTQDKDAIAEQIASGLAQLDRGEGIPGDVARERLQRRKAEFLREQNPS